MKIDTGIFEIHLDEHSQFETKIWRAPNSDVVEVRQAKQDYSITSPNSRDCNVFSNRNEKGYILERFDIQNV